MTLNATNLTTTDVAGFYRSGRELSRGHYLAWLLLCVWIVGACAAFWRFFYQDSRWFVEHPEHLPHSLPLLPAFSRPVLLHFVDPDCSCTRFSVPHIATLKARYPAIDHIEVVPGDPLAHRFTQDLPPFLSSPSVALVNAEGGVRYFGPYTAGRVCGTGEDLLAGPVSALQASVPVQGSINFLHFGCYCAWPGNPAQASATQTLI